MNIFLPSIRITKKVESTFNRFYKSILYTKKTKEEKQKHMEEEEDGLQGTEMEGIGQ